MPNSLTRHAGARRGRRYTAIALTAVTTAALALAATTATAATVTLKPGPSVPSAGVNSKEALAADVCDAKTGTMKITYSTRPPCVRPYKKGENNGGATAAGVTKDAINVVVVVPTADQQAAAAAVPGATPQSLDRSTGKAGTLQQNMVDFAAVYAHDFNTWGREIKFDFYNPTGGDEAAQRADALAVTQKKPFIVINLGGTSGGGAIFDGAIAANKIIIIGAGTNSDAQKQAPYRYINGADTDATAVNAAQFVANTLSGKPAKYAGDTAIQSKTRKFGVVHNTNSTGINYDAFVAAYKKAGGKVADLVDVPYTLGEDATQYRTLAQNQAPTLAGKLKSENITTVVLFTGLQDMTPSLLAAQTSGEFYPENVMTGFAFQDVDLLARGWDAKQTAHLFGIGSAPIYVTNQGSNSDSVYFDNYWGKDKGTFASSTNGQNFLMYEGIQMAGPKLTVKTFQQGVFSKPATGGAAVGFVGNFMNGWGRSSGLPYDEYSAVGLDYSMKWWDPTAVGVSVLVRSAAAAGKYEFLNNAKRYASGQWPKGDQAFFDKTQSVFQLDTLPAAETIEVFPCVGCPSSGSTK
jgi:hypothetical protein